MLTGDTDDARRLRHKSGAYLAYKPPPAPFEDIYFTVALEGIIDVPLPDQGFSCHARRWYSPTRSGGLTAFMIHGIGHNFNFFAPLAATLLDPLGGFVEGVTEVYAVDLPGHGGSQSPPNIKFGLLTLDHYVSALRQALAALKRRGPLDIVCGHSMGGLLAMLLEQSFLSDGTTLEEAHGTRGVVLLAPAIPEEVPWSLTTGPFDARGPVSPALAILTPFITANAAYGPFVYASDEDYLKTFFGVEGGLAAGSPSLIEAGALNCMESYAAGSELAGIDLDREEWSTFERPHVRQALFSRYAFGLACYSEDFLFKPEEEAALGIYLYGAGEGWTFLPITNRDAIHNSPYSQPARTSKVFADVISELERRAEAPGRL
jgi:pimeloyl-ACP methyl ester carboxylesterase